jgi:hypothetical protein
MLALQFMSLALSGIDLSTRILSGCRGHSRLQPIRFEGEMQCVR